MRLEQYEAKVLEGILGFSLALKALRFSQLHNEFNAKVHCITSKDWLDPIGQDLELPFLFSYDRRVVALYQVVSDLANEMAMAPRGRLTARREIVSSLAWPLIDVLILLETVLVNDQEEGLDPSGFSDLMTRKVEQLDLCLGNVKRFVQDFLQHPSS